LIYEDIAEAASQKNTRENQNSHQRKLAFSLLRGQFQSKLFVLLVPGGGANPHDRKGRRILSLILGILQGVAA